MEIAQTLLPNSPLLRLENWQINLMATQIILTVVSTQELACCPICHQVSDRIHSHYERTLADLPWGEYQVYWQLQVRKFFCNNPDCQRQIFTERLPDVVAPWARKTDRMAQRQTSIGLARLWNCGSEIKSKTGLHHQSPYLVTIISKIPKRASQNPNCAGC